MKTWNSFPMLRVIAPFILGVVSMAFLVEEIRWDTQARLLALVSFIVLVGITLVAGFFTRENRFGLIASLLMFISGCALVISISEHVYPNQLREVDLDGWQTFVVRIDDEPQVREKSVKVIANLTDESFSKASRVLLYFQTDSVSKGFKFGDVVAVRTNLEVVENPGNPNEFNYKRYLRFNGIRLRGYVASGKYDVLSTDNLGFWGRIHGIRSNLIKKLEAAQLTGDELSVASALILGYKAELDKELMSAYAGAGATHVLAVSGLHVGIVYVVINMLLRFMDRRQETKIVKTILVILLLFGYACLTGLSASVFRAATMFSFVAVGKAIKRDTNIFNTLAASAFVLMAIDPLIIMQVGFQLSYAAVLGIVVIQPKLFEKIAFPNSRLLDWAWSITCVSIAAQIATAPLGLLYFHQFPNFFWVSNLFVIPAAGVILYLGLSLFVFGVWEPASKFIGFLLQKLISIVNYLVKSIEEIPYSVLEGIDISTLETVMIYMMIIGFLVFALNEAKWGLYTGLTLGIAFMGLQIHETHLQKNQRFITVYNVQGETAIALFNGTDVTFIGSEEFYNDEQSMLFHVRHHWWRRGVESETFVDLTDSVLNCKLTWNGKEILIADLSRESYETMEVEFYEKDIDIVLLADIDWKLCHKLRELEYNQLVIMGNIGEKMTQRIGNNTSSGELIAVESSGAFTIR